jgi:hypothetical protein
VRASEEALITQHTGFPQQLRPLGPEMRPNSGTVPYYRGSGGTPFFHSDQ